MRTVRDSLEAQVRSWKSKAEAAEKRAAAERDKRRGLEAGGKGSLAQASIWVETASDRQPKTLTGCCTFCELSWGEG